MTVCDMIAVLLGIALIVSIIYVSALRDFNRLCGRLVKELERLSTGNEIVRCEDCEHCLLDLSGQECHLCMRVEHSLPVRGRRRADDFCSYGKRKTTI